MSIRTLALSGALAAAFVTSVSVLPAAHGSTPGTNGRIAFGRESADSTQIYVLDPATGSAVRLTHSVDHQAFNPDWSPNGRQIVFEWSNEQSATVRLIDADGSHAHDIVPAGLSGFFGQPAFVPHTRLIVFERFDPTTLDDSLWVMGRDGSHPRRLTTSPFPGTGGDTDPNVSPDGRTVSFVRESVADDQQALFSVRIDGTGLTQLLPYRDDLAVKHDWSPDGRHIVVTVNANVGSRPDESANVMVLRSDGTHRRLLTHYTGRQIDAYAGSFSPDGRWIVYRIENGDGTGTLPGGRYALLQIHPWGGPSTLLAAVDGRPRFIDWGTQPG